MKLSAIHFRIPALILALGALTASLSGCVPLVIGGVAAGTTIVATDRRSVGEQAEDETIELKISTELTRQFGDTARIQTTTYLNRVLLTGDAFSEKIKNQAGEIAAKTQSVQSVANEVRIGPIASFADVSSDTWITSKVKATLATTNEVPSNTISVTTSHGVVYLMGLVTQREGDLAAVAASRVSGVKKVEKFFQVMTPEQEARMRAKQQESTNLPSSNPTPRGEAPPASPAAGTAAGAAPAASSSPVSPGAVEVLPIK